MHWLDDYLDRCYVKTGRIPNRVRLGSEAFAEFNRVMSAQLRPETILSMHDTGTSYYNFNGKYVTVCCDLTLGARQVGGEFTNGLERAIEKVRGI